MRRLAVPAGAVCVALVGAACGGTRQHDRVQQAIGSLSTQTLTGVISAGTTTVATRTTRQPPTPDEIERAARLTAARPGFAARLSARVSLPQLGGNAVTAVGNGVFDPRTDSGTLGVAVGLPGLLGLAGPLPTQVRLVGGEAYVQVPSDIAGELGTSAGWLEDSVSALGLGNALSPADILREVARDATQTIPAQRARVTIDPATGLVRTIVLRYTLAGGYRVRVRLTLTGFAPQAATVAPAPAGGLSSALRTLGF